jgi:hypothetical protein
MGTERVRAFVAWLNTVEHPHWEQPGFADFADLTPAERQIAARILHLQADARFAHARKLEGEVAHRIEMRAGASPPEIECPPATNRRASNAVGAIAAAPYTATGANGNNIRVPRQLVEQTVVTLIACLDTADGDADGEVDDPVEPDGDGDDCAWIEWGTMRGSQKRGPNIAAGHEDDEPDDAPEDDDPDSEHDGRELEEGL